MSESQKIWYVAYGSNMDPAQLGRYLPPGDREMKQITVPRSMYFAGWSRRWSSGVAFLTLDEVLGEYSEAVAYSVTEDELGEIFRRENGAAARLPPLDELALPMNRWRTIAIPESADGAQGKYNAVMRLEDVSGTSAYTFSTSRALPRNPPSPKYLLVIRQTLEKLVAQDVESYLDACITREPIQASSHTSMTTDLGTAWAGRLIDAGFAGFPSVRLPANCSPYPWVRLARGTLMLSGKRLEVWVRFDAPDGTDGLIGRSLHRSLNPDGSPQEAVVVTNPLVFPTRTSGLARDIPGSDVVQMRAEDVAAFGSRWAIAITPHFPGPVRIEPREHVPLGAVRVSYALRQMLALENTDRIALQPIPQRHRSTRSAIIRMVRIPGELLLGAPVVALRATEGLVGDDGRMVVRVDGTVLDYLGLRPGMQAVLSWAERAVTVRVLLQTGETSRVMDRQLAEATGNQTRATLTDIDSRSRTPEHLRVWVSSTARTSLGVPPDTLVRLRRSVHHVMLRSASDAAVPAAGLIIATVAIPDVPAIVWIGAGLLVLALVLAPLRLRSTSSRKGQRSTEPKWHSG